MRLTRFRPGRFEAEVTIENTGAAPLNQWYVQWMMPMGITMTRAWHGMKMQSGPVGMIHAPESSPRLAPGKKASARFTATLKKGEDRPRFTDVTCG
ncbi:hypothetical protein Sru01_42440 [Sphaerisporangium rufum]|uniref:CBM2 domain-containing protein n=1 Tax=Sphaerisporangium rufum TaxID=1381558 RepID=A0A919R3Z2_9ACTN|nr:hypothetical protein Sru01_42440 [Sphaerisporangium rufum]